jgi:transposase
VAKTATARLPKELLEQIYEEVEQRVEAKFRARIESLEKQVEKYREEAHVWRRRYFKEKERSQALENELSLARAEIKGLKEVIEKQNVRIAGLEKQLYGRKTEASKKPAPPDSPEKRSRGRQPGSKGHGRKKRTSLEVEECVHDFEPSERVCTNCGMPYEEIGTKTSEVIDISFRLVRVIHIRKTRRRTCKCSDSPRIKTAPAPPKLFRGSLFSTEFWHYIIFDKYHLQRPMNRVRMLLDSYSLPVSQGTITNALKRLHDRKVLKPLVEDIAERVRRSKQQQMDESSWKIFQETEGKEGFLHWLWVRLAEDCCLFTIDPSRSREVARRSIGDDPVVVTSDMLNIYKNLGENVTNSWCWAHVRRYILKLLAYPALKKSAQQWLDKVDWLYHCNNQRLSAQSSQEFQLHEATLRAAVDEFERHAKSYASRSKHPEARKVFKMISQHWNGLSLFVDLPSIPMDNNASERALRNPIVGRKNYYGSGSCWSGEFAADLFTIFSTLDMNGINCRTWLHEYLHAVACNKGRAPANATSFLPWNSPPVDLLSS